MLDLLLKNARIITMSNGGAGVIKHGALGIKGNTIACVGDSDEIESSHSAARTIDLKGKLLFPGFVNAHTHSTTGLGKGILVGIDNYLEQGLTAYNEGITAASQIASSKLHILEGVKRGYTTYNDTNFGSDVIAHVHEQFGTRARISELVRELPWDVMDQQGEVYRLDPAYAERYVDASKRLLEKYGTAPDKRISAMVACQGLDYCSEKLVLELRDLARAHNAMMHIHVAQAPSEVEQCSLRWGKTPVQILKDMGMLHEGTMGAHMTSNTDEDTVAAAQSGMPLLTTPTSYANFGDVSPIAKYLDAGGLVALGSDECAYTNVNPFTALRMCLMHANMGARQAGLKPVRVLQLLKMLTIDAAKAIGLGDQVGSLEVGKKADMIVIDPYTVTLMPLLTDPLINFVNSLVVAATGDEVETVIIDGRIVVEERKVLTVDEQEVLREVQYEGQLAADKAFAYFSSLKNSEVLAIQADY